MDASESGNRERWSELLDPLYNCDGPTALRHDGDDDTHERYYTISSEVLADKLLGYDDDLREDEYGLLSPEVKVMPSHPIWKAVAGAATGLLAAFPLVLVASVLASSPDASRFFLTFLGPRISQTFRVWVTTANVSVRTTLLDSRSFLQELTRVRVWPLAMRIVRKCVVLEAWRQVWTRFYKLTRFVYKGTLGTAAKLYVKLCPAWIRRGIRALLQSTVQGEVHGALGGMLGGITFDSLWTSSEASEAMSGADGMGDVLSESAVQSALDAAAEQSTSSAVELMANSVDVDSLVDGAAHAAAEIIEGSGVVDAVMEGVEEVIESTLEDALADSVTEYFESSVDGALDFLADDSVIESALENVVDGIMESSE